MNIKTFLLAALFVAFGTALSAQKLANDVALDGLHGKVKQVTKITYEARTDFTGVTSEGDGHGSTFWIWIPCEIIPSFGTRG